MTLRTVVLSTRVTEREAKQLAKEARTQDMTVSNYLRFVVLTRARRYGDD